MSDCRGPDFCIDDLCVHSDQGLCGKWSLASMGLVDEAEDELYGYPDESDSGDWCPEHAKEKR